MYKPQSNKELRELIASFPDLQNIISDPNTNNIILDFRGDWSYEKLGRIRSDKPPLSPANITRILVLFSEEKMLHFGDWVLHRYQGAFGDLLVFERRPTNIIERMSVNISTELRSAVRAPGDGVIMGPIGCRKNSILSWLTAQVTDAPLLFISEIPPATLPGKHVRHVFPPSQISERRNFERLLRLSNHIFWDGMRSKEDFRSLMGNASAQRRWFTMDGMHFGKTSARMYRWAEDFELNLKTVFTVSRSAIGRAEPESLLRLNDLKWTETHRKDNTYVDFLEDLQNDSITRNPVFVRPSIEIKTNFREPNPTIQASDQMGSFDSKTGVISESSLRFLVDVEKVADSKDTMDLQELTRQYKIVSKIEPLSVDKTKENKLPNLLLNKGYKKEVSPLKSYDPLSNLPVGHLISKRDEFSNPTFISDEDIFEVTHVSEVAVEDASFSYFEEIEELEEIDEIEEFEDITNPQNETLISESLWPVFKNKEKM